MKVTITNARPASRHHQAGFRLIPGDNVFDLDADGVRNALTLADDKFLTVVVDATEAELEAFLAPEVDEVDEVDGVDGGDEVDLSKLKRPELVALCEDLGLPAGGTKAELIARLEE